MSSSTQDNTDMFFDIDFDINTPISMECSVKPNYVIPGEKYPRLSSRMELEDFKKWNMSYLQEFLGDRGINRTGNKATLVTNAFNAYKLNLPVTQTDAMQEQNEIQQDHDEKLVVDRGLIKLPDPNSLREGWFPAPMYLPNVTFNDVESYLKKHSGGKAFKGGKSLMESGHIKNIMTHTINPDVRFSFVKALCHPEQKITNNPYTVWVCLRESGSIWSGGCTCVAGVSGVCKHVGGLLWCIEREVRLGNNLTCTSKPQKWHVPSNKQQRLHGPAALCDINIKKPKPENILHEKEPALKKSKLSFQEQCKPKMTENDIDTLSEITNGNCGIILLMRKKTNDTTNLKNVATEIEIETSPHVDIPASIPQTIKKIKQCGDKNLSNIFDKLSSKNSLSKSQITLLSDLTKDQANCQVWHDQRVGRVTGSTFFDAASKVQDEFNIKNPDKCKSIISKICGYSKPFLSKATTWGKDNEPLAKSVYLNKNKKLHKKLKIDDCGFFLFQDNPIFGASPDGIISCACHNSGLLEVKCPWTNRGSLISDYALLKESCLEKCGKSIRLKRNHRYYYQVQCQLAVTRLDWCDFFVCTTKDSFQERIYFDEKFWNDNKLKVEYFYKKIILPELLKD